MEKAAGFEPSKQDPSQELSSPETESHHKEAEGGSFWPELRVSGRGRPELDPTVKNVVISPNAFRNSHKSPVRS